MDESKQLTRHEYMTLVEALNLWDIHQEEEYEEHREDESTALLNKISRVMGNGAHR